VTENPSFKGQLTVAKIGLIDRVLDGKGRDVMRLPGGPQRLADCANALKDIWFPLAHVPRKPSRALLRMVDTQTRRIRRTKLRTAWRPMRWTPAQTA
jgi:hypothetical protein